MQGMKQASGANDARCIMIGLAVLLIGIPGVLRADTFKFKDGRVVIGQVVNRKEVVPEGKAAVEVFTVQVAPGVFVQIIDSDLKRNGYIPVSDKQLNYVSNVQNISETVGVHDELAGICQAEGMSELAEAHYWRVLDLDPDNREARSALDYKNVAGQWVKLDKLMREERGKVKYQGRWHFPEMLKVEQEQEKSEERYRYWKRELNRLNSMAISQSRKSGEALQTLRAIDDPNAIAVIAEILQKQNNKLPLPMKRLYVTVLTQMQHPAAAQVLSQLSMNDPSDAIRDMCYSALKNYGRETAIGTYVSYLQNDNPELINRAADGLAEMQAETAVLPLIDALVTQHKRTTGGGSQMNVNMQGGLAFGGGPKEVKLNSENDRVLGTLSQLTGQNFGFDEERWMTWYASVHATPAGDLRRDP